MSWRRIKVSILILGLMVASIGVHHAASIDWSNGNPGPSGGDPDCDNRSLTVGGNIDQGAGGCVAGAAPTFPANMGELAFTAGLQTGVIFVDRGVRTLVNANSSDVACGTVDECDCDTAQLIATRLFNSYKRRIAGPACPTPLPPGFAVWQRITVSSLTGGPAAGPRTACTAPGTCADLFNDNGAILEIKQSGAGSDCGFNIVKDPNGLSLTFDRDPPCDLSATYKVTNGGNLVGLDLLPDYLLQIRRNGVNGVVRVEILETPTSVPVVFTVDTTGKTNAQVAADLVTGFNGAGFNLGATVVSDAAAAGSILETKQPGTYEAGQPVVRILNAGRRVCGINVRGVVVGGAGQAVLAENIDTNAVPTLSEWAMIIVALLLLGSGYWLFRRQRNLSTV